ncbi:hypothetical protein CR956_00460 [Candidatus Saccharibacteria bacterium]|nr:MAG: hypothetical protein CR956_00460 [Candidatus Saccharibacteria bacterium]
MNSEVTNLEQSPIASANEKTPLVDKNKKPLNLSEKLENDFINDGFFGFGDDKQVKAAREAIHRAIYLGDLESLNENEERLTELIATAKHLSSAIKRLRDLTAAELANEANKSKDTKKPLLKVVKDQTEPKNTATLEKVEAKSSPAENVEAANPDLAIAA